MLLKNNVDKLINIKNRVEQSRLCEELKKIERQRKYDMKIFNIKVKKFKSKFSKYNLDLPVDTTDVKMYETHHPGFCYKRNGEQRNFQQIDNNFSSIMDYEDLYNLVFTDGIVDLKKILFLHLISVHKSEHLVSPKKSECFKDPHLPVAKLLHRSKKGYNHNTRLTRLLPFYNIKTAEKNENVITDGRFAARILVNETLRKLIDTVVCALEKTNHAKFQKLIDIAREPEEIRKIFDEGTILNFPDKLWKNPLISSCDSFVLTPPFKFKTIDVIISSNSESAQLVQVIHHIRNNVLQMPKRKVIMEKENIPETSSTDLKITTFIKKKTDNPVTVSKPLLFMEATPKNIFDAAQKSTRYGKKNFIQKNIEEAGKTKKIPYEDDDDVSSILSRRSSSSSSRTSRRSSSIKSKTIPPAIAEENNQDTGSRTSSKADVNQPKVSTTEATSSKSNEIAGPSLPFSDRTKNYHIKRTTCPACVDKWKKPLPEPKVPKLRRSADSGRSSKPVIKTDSLNRMKMLITKELYNLESYKKRYSMDNNPFRGFTHKQQLANDDDDVSLSPMELAKISQEIKEKEVIKMLDKFLTEPI